MIGGERQLEAAYTLLARYEDLAGMAAAGVDELARVPGVGPARAAALKAALELGRRMVLAPEARLRIKNPADAVDLFRLVMGTDAREQEEFWAAFLTHRCDVIGTERIYRGTVNATPTRPADVFRAALRRNAAAIIVAHSHPSGDPEPSPEDITVTQDLIGAGSLLGIEVLDHLVIGGPRWVSIRRTRPDLWESATSLARLLQA